ncbi:Myb-like DNA-binding domain containing protein [Tritrichomonas foetus]|uniref:Myb-like DNA-binding domain containing protein n=1 Tax=Tritrichomonas foetus TaxID=1144522 RepID=A0A1J4JGP7_9EUKA|nr:Myb-like DNA-binding domain containing protein [Tritrichomonas foetus]|eukprot:OHS96629.1 Myb-like DNA-binding domain containing protein [Tritrichomonas foetus]
MEPPLLAIANSYIEESSEHCQEDAKLAARKCLEELIDNKITPEVALSTCYSILGVDTPAKNICAILAISPEPINFSQPLFNYHSTRHHVRKWSKYEDQRLIAGVHRLGFENWTKIAEFVGNGRTRSQCSQRWLRGLDPSISKDKWTDEEESQLIRLVSEYGTKAWRRISTQMKNRSDVQCRYHFAQLKRSKRSGKILSMQKSMKETDSQSFIKNDLIDFNTQDNINMYEMNDAKVQPERPIIW